MKQKILTVLSVVLVILSLTLTIYISEQKTAQESALNNVKQATPWTKYGDDVEPHQSAVFCGEFNREEICWVVTID